ncbi:unnamed protein product [Phytophthora fragariaefolia]|uniref:Unnamed protein product n=1 Tax=Phytophthora fragariaefolia TaxID=1490495 RepID=A0A9W7CZ11_9STRA|nr:unnamed protein product [Phytophthora fragariaefolia]
MLIASDLEDAFQSGVNALQIVQASMEEAAKIWTHDGLTQHHWGARPILANAVLTYIWVVHKEDGTPTPAPYINRVKFAPNLTLEPTNCELHLALIVYASDGICYPVTEIVSKRLHAGASENSTDATTGPNEDNETDSVTSDDKSDVSPADLIDSMNFIRDIEQAEQLPITSTAGSSSETTYTIQKTQCEEKRAYLAITWNSRSSNTDLATTPAMTNSSPLKARTKTPERRNTISPLHYPTNALAGVTVKTTGAYVATYKGGTLEVLRIPKSKPRHNTRTKLKQTRLSKTAKPQRLAIITLPDKNLPSLFRVSKWASNTIDRHHVSEILTNYPNIMNDEFMKARVAHSSTEYVCSAEYDYNFVIPKCLVVQLDAVVKAE